MKGKIVRTRITRDTNLDFDRISEGRGVYHCTLQNFGDTVAIIDDAAPIELRPGETFVIESPLPIVNTVFPIVFKNERNKQNALHINYIVEVFCKNR